VTAPANPFAGRAGSAHRQCRPAPRGFLRPFGLSLVLAFGLTACTLGPNFVTPDSEVAPGWREQSPELRAAKGATDRDWWRALGSPTLDTLVEAAYRNNPNLQVAGVRVLQAQAQLNIAVGAQYPQQQAASGSLDYRSRDPGVLDSDGELFSKRVALGASWELDFWGKYRRGVEADRAALFSTLAAYDDALVTLVASVANAFVALRTLSAQQAIYVSNAASQAEGLRIAQVRFENGETSALDVSQATTRLEETRAQIPNLEQQWRQSANSLSLLLGETPGAADSLVLESSDVPRAPESVDVGIPRDLLRRRPDVREALEAAAAQSAGIGIAESALYPSFSLSGAFGFGSTNSRVSASDLFTWDSRFGQVGGSFLFPIFNYGRLINQVRVQDAVFQEAVLNYQNTVLAAQGDVESALAAFVYGKRTVAAMEKAAASARRTTGLALEEYKEGQTGFTALLKAYDSQLQVENALAEARGQVLLGLISVYRALGGGWQIREGKSLITKQVADDMRQRTNWGRMLSTEGYPGPSATPPPASRGKNEPKGGEQ
jgi:NodT family efflux transporter outer membrane factor (OMF) lipoprotein